MSLNSLKDARFWLAVAVVVGFAILTGSVYAKATTFEEGFQLWDNLAVIFSALIGGLLGFTVNYTRATQAESRATNKEIEATAARDAAAEHRRRVAAMQPIIERIIELADRRMNDNDSAIIRESLEIDDTPRGQATSGRDGTRLADRMSRVSNADPDLLMIADHARRVLDISTP